MTDATTASTGLTAAERAAIRQRAEELKANESAAEALRSVLEKIASLDEPDRTNAERIHAIVTEVAPSLRPKLYYGSPAYADADGRVVLFYQERAKFTGRYGDLGFFEAADLDDGTMWPTGFAVTELSPADGLDRRPAGREGRRRAVSRADGARKRGSTGGRSAHILSLIAGCGRTEDRNPFMALYELLRPSMRLWHAGLLAQAPSIPQPKGQPRSALNREAIDRVLLVGNGPLHGWGVLSHELSAVGHLSRALTAATGRLAVVDYAGDARMTAATSLEWLGERAADGYDVVVVVLSMTDALRLAPVDAFAMQYGRLVQRILADIDERAEVVLMTMPHVGRYSQVHGWAGAIAKRHAQRLSDRVRSFAVGVDRVRIIEAPVEHFSAGRPFGSAEFYGDWAEQAVRSVAPVLEEVRRVKPATTDDRPERSAMVRAATATPDPALVRLSEEAKQRFGVAIAGVSLADGDRIAVAAQTGGAPASMPRSLMYCGAVFSSGAPVLVPDRAHDERFRDSELIDLLGTPFYAGVPLHGADGSVVGAFCVLDSATHDSDFVRFADLAPFAVQAEAELQRLAASAPEVEVAQV